MSDIRTTFQHHRHQARLPDVDADRCVLTQLANASCSACVDVCPRQAWLLSDSGLGLDTESCDSCGLCIPACTEGAIQKIHEPAKRHWQGQDVAFAACERAELEGTEGTIPCIHGLGYRDLLLLYRQGINTLKVVCGDCSFCERGNAPRLGTMVSTLNLLMDGRDQPPFNYVEQSLEAWLLDFNVTEVDARGEDIGRRDFMRKALSSVIHERPLEQKLTNFRTDWSTPPGKMLPPSQPGALSFFSPRIDTDSCNGCDACIRLCLHGAITLDWGEIQGQPRYRLSPDSCSGCGLCVDVCDRGAISLGSLESPVLTEVQLVSRRCPACGAHYHRPKDRTWSSKGLCRICNTSNHHGNLFQFIEAD